MYSDWIYTIRNYILKGNLIQFSYRIFMNDFLLCTCDYILLIWVKEDVKIFFSEPRSDITAALIHTFLKMCGFKLVQFYGVQFWKIMHLLNHEYFVKIEKVLFFQHLIITLEICLLYSINILGDINWLSRTSGSIKRIFWKCFALWLLSNTRRFAECY